MFKFIPKRNIVIDDIASIGNTFGDYPNPTTICANVLLLCGGILEINTTDNNARERLARLADWIFLSGVNSVYYVCGHYDDWLKYNRYSDIYIDFERTLMLRNITIDKPTLDLPINVKFNNDHYKIYGIDSDLTVKLNSWNVIANSNANGDKSIIISAFPIVSNRSLHGINRKFPHKRGKSFGLYGSDRVLKLNKKLDGISDNWKVLPVFDKWWYGFCAMSTINASLLFFGGDVTEEMKYTIRFVRNNSIGGDNHTYDWTTHKKNFYQHKRMKCINVVAKPSMYADYPISLGSNIRTEPYHITLR